MFERRLTEICAYAAEAAEFPARRRAAGLSFRSSATPSDYHVGRTNINRSSVPTVERSQDSPRDVHNPRDMSRQSMPAVRNLMSRSRSRDRHGSSAEFEEGSLIVARGVGPASALSGVAEAPAEVGDALAAARQDHRSRRMLVQRSDSAKMGPLETHQEVV